VRCGGANLSGLILLRELDERLGLGDLSREHLKDPGGV
jgi:hypothetical protein